MTFPKYTIRESFQETIARADETVLNELLSQVDEDINMNTDTHRTRTDLLSEFKGRLTQEIYMYLSDKPDEIKTPNQIKEWIKSTVLENRETLISEFKDNLISVLNDSTQWLRQRKWILILPFLLWLGGKGIVNFYDWTQSDNILTEENIRNEKLEMASYNYYPLNEKQNQDIKKLIIFLSSNSSNTVEIENEDVKTTLTYNEFEKKRIIFSKSYLGNEKWLGGREIDKTTIFTIDLKWTNLDGSKDIYAKISQQYKGISLIYSEEEFNSFMPTLLQYGIDTRQGYLQGGQKEAEVPLIEFPTVPSTLNSEDCD